MEGVLNKSFKGAVNKLMEDVFTNILLRLPVKSLLRLRCVSKGWCDLIKSPDFIGSHLNHPIAESDHRVLVKRCLQDRHTNILSIHQNTVSLDIIPPEIQLPYLYHQSVEFMGPCRGIICISDKESIILYNPAIKEFTLLPESSLRGPLDMNLRHRAVGFGFDRNTNDCKVIRIVEFLDRDDYNVYGYKAELYRCCTDSWSDFDYALPDINFEPNFETFFNDAAHWNATREYEKILAFSITSEVFQEFDFPETCELMDGKRNCLTILNEFLALFKYTCPMGHPVEQLFEIWIMKEYGVSESWTKQIVIGPLSKIDHPIITWRNSYILLEKINGQLISCTLDTQEIKEFDIIGFQTTLRALVYKESLVSIPRTSDHGVL